MKTLTTLLIAMAYNVMLAAELTPRFLDRLAMVESGMNDAAVNEAEGAHGRYQIRQCYLDDANEKLGTSYTLQDMHDPEKAAKVVIAYLTRYGDSYERRTGHPASDEVLARIHNGGPRGAEKAATIPYWRKFVQVKQEMANWYTTVILMEETK